MKSEATSVGSIFLDVKPLTCGLNSPHIPPKKRVKSNLRGNSRTDEVLGHGT